MKKTMLTLALLLSCAVQAQSTAHDYLLISLSPFLRNCVVDVARDEQRVLDLKELNGKSEAMDVRSALDLVQQYELLGWELYAFERDSPGTSGVLEKWTWLMRKPKQ